jgi:hypothetical protein
MQSVAKPLTPSPTLFSVGQQTTCLPCSIPNECTKKHHTVNKNQVIKTNQTGKTETHILNNGITVSGIYNTGLVQVRRSAGLLNADKVKP